MTRTTNRRTPGIRLAIGATAGSLALAALSGVTTSAGAAPAAPAAPAERSSGPSAAATTQVSTSLQLRRAVRKANAREGQDRIVLRRDIDLGVGRGAGNGPMRGDLDVTDDLVIVGNGNTLNVRGVDRAFDVRPGTRLAIQRLTIANAAATTGESGGAIRSQGTLVVRGSTISASVARGEGASGGAIFNDGGTATVIDSRLLDNRAERAGGAVEALGGRTVIRGTTMSRNATGTAPGNGGAVHLTGAGEVEVRGSTVTGNGASAEGGGLWNSAEGTFLVDRTTVSGNVATGAAADQGGGGIFNDGGEMLVTRSTVTDNRATGAAGSGGGILNDGGDLDLRTTTVSGNSAPRAGGGVEADGGTTALRSVTLEGNTTGDAPGNGGGLHLTGAGTVLVLGSTVVANEAGSEGGGLWNSADGEFLVNGTEVRGNFARGAAADNGGGGVFNDGGNLVVQDSQLVNNAASGAAGSGGGLFNDQGETEVTGTTIRGNVATRAGGGVEANIGTTTIRDSVLDQNATGPNPGNGGGFHLTGAGEVTVAGTQVTGNTASAEGGGLWNSATGTFTVTDSTITGNTAEGAAADQGGGGLFNDGGTLTVTGSTVDGNQATGAAGSGGGLLNNLGTLVVTDTVVSGNDAPRAGGGIETNVGRVTLTGVDLTDNTTGANPGNGGGFHTTGAGIVLITGGSVTGNSAAAQGGGLWNSSTGSMTVTGATIEDNTAPLGADLYHQPPAEGIFLVDGQPVPPTTP